ncbi:MAG: SH3 domain-containing protein [Pseudooceanicola sp.]
MRLVIISTIFMGWAFYELSGGAEFVPPSQRGAAQAETASAAASQIQPENASAAGDAEVASRAAASPSLSGLTFARVSSEPKIAPQAEPAVETAVSRPETAVAPAKADQPEERDIGEGTLRVIALTATDTPPARPEAEPQAIPASATDRDLREVSASAVNMRNGPGTRYNVMDRLGRGDIVEVLQDPGSGWVKLRVDSTGRVGWIADFLLASVE